MRILKAAIFGLVFGAGLPIYTDAEEPPLLHLTSRVFEDGGSIPQTFACDGKNISPALEWTGVPRGTENLVLIVDDPDAPAGVFTHWVVYNLPPSLRSLPQGMPPAKKLMNSERQGVNGFGNLGYGGPCPPAGEHHYVFTLYAVSKPLDFKNPPTKDEVLKAIEGKILATAKLTGKYQKQAA